MRELTLAKASGADRDQVRITSTVTWKDGDSNERANERG